MSATASSSNSACGSPGTRQTVRRRPARSLTSGGAVAARATPRPAGAAIQDAQRRRNARPATARRPDSRARSRHHGRAARPPSLAADVGQRTDQAPARLRGPQRTLELRAGDVEHVAVALGEPPLRPPEPGDDRLAATAADADRDLVLHPRRVQQVAVELAAGERAGLHDLRQPQGRAPAGRVRCKQGMVARVPDDRLECASGLRPDRARLVTDLPRGQLDAVPR